MHTQTDVDENHILAHIQWCESQGSTSYNYSPCNQTNDSHATLQTPRKEWRGEGEKSMHKRQSLREEKVQAETTWEGKKSRGWWWDGWTQRQEGRWRTREECFCLWCRGEKSNQPCVIQSGMERWCTLASVCAEGMMHIIIMPYLSQTHTQRR